MTTRTSLSVLAGLAIAAGLAADSPAQAVAGAMAPAPQPAALVESPVSAQEVIPAAEGAFPAEADQFARPVEEEITQEIIEQTDLSEAGSSIIGQIFQSEEQIRRLLGADAQFIYRSGQRRDPMIIPWIRREYDRQQLLAAAQEAEQAGDVATALQSYRQLREGYAGSREAGVAQEAIARLEARLIPSQTVAGTSSAPQAVTVSLPMEVARGLSGIIGAPGAYNCLIGSEIYAEGDKIPNYDVTISEIRQDAVVFEYQSQQFTVPMVMN